VRLDPKRILLVVVVTWAALASTALRVHAATPSPSEELRVVAVDTAAAPKVAVTVAVPAALSSEKLPDRAFTVTEAGKKRIPHITRLPTDALAVVLAIDTSGSMEGSAIESAKAAATTFVQQMPPETRVAVVGFSDAPSVISDFTTDRSALAAAINRVAATGETALYDGIDRSSSMLAGTGDARRALVVLSDGKDTSSNATEAQASAALQSASTSFYAVSLVTPDSDSAALARVADAAGGRVVSASDPGGLAGVYNDIAREIANQYQFTFRSIGSGATDLQVAVDWNDVHASTNLQLALPEAESGAAAAPAEPPAATTSDEPLVGGATWALVLGAALLFVALTAAGLLLFMPRTPRSTIAVEAAAKRPGTAPVKISGLVDSATQFADQTLERRGHHRTLNDALERAGIDMRPGEFVVLAVAVSAGVAFVGLVLLGPIVGLVLGACTAIGFRAFVSARAERRRRKFAEQLGDTLQFMAGSLRAGHGLLQAVDSVAEESESPTREEFGRIVIETRFGQDLNAALAAAAERVGNEDFDWVVQAIEIHRDVGGDLSEVLDHVAATIRSRNSIRRQVQALSAEGRLSAVILFILPIALTGIIAVTNPSYLDELLDTTAGNVLIGLGVALMIVGGFWMRRLVRLRF
jgi:tight adherence protein B